MLDDIAQVSVPSWILRGCASAGAKTIMSATAIAAAAAKALRSIMDTPSPGSPSGAVGARIVAEKKHPVGLRFLQPAIPGRAKHEPGIHNHRTGKMISADELRGL